MMLFDVLGGLLGSVLALVVTLLVFVLALVQVLLENLVGFLGGTVADLSKMALFPIKLAAVPIKQIYTVCFSNKSQ